MHKHAPVIEMARLLKNTYFRYFRPSRSDRDWGIFVTTAGYLKAASGSSYPPKGHPREYEFSWEAGRTLHEFQIHYIARGSGVFESEGGGKHVIEAGSVFVLFPGVWHRYTIRPPMGWDEYWVGFSGQYADRLLQKGFLTPSQPVIKPRDEHSLLELFTQMFSEMQTERTGFSQIIGSITASMVANINAFSRSQQSNYTRSQAVIERVKSLLCERLEQTVDLHELADELRVGYAWLRCEFRRHTGLALHQYHLQLRVNKAMALLSGSDTTIKEIGSQTGFEDAHYFSRIFKRKTGYAPEDWRRLSRK
jgi:AraC-like DNA-binding protein